jgi:hypothetical protein
VSADPRYTLVDALLATPGQRALYRQSPTFRHGVDTLAALLPAWVSGLEARAAETDRAMELAVEAAKTAPPRWAPDDLERSRAPWA